MTRTPCRLGPGGRYGVVLACAVAALVSAETAPATDPALFFNLLKPSPGVAWKSLGAIEAGWREHHAPMLLEVARFSPHHARILRFLGERAGRSFEDAEEAFRWVWSRPASRHPDYARFKTGLYRAIDPRFAGYFDDATTTARIRLDEVRWGGVKRDGIVPLVDPRLLDVSEAGYLADGDVVFAAVVNGEARAYPKRILGWHELVRDEIGGDAVTGVYCTLCGSMILYRSEHAGVRHELGTSGFLYRSNKLMVDTATDSLWSTLRGEPVIGPLAGQDIRLEPLPIVTTTWGSWRKRHPDTRVLSHRTRQRHDYSEGAAYRDYFATQELLFAVPDPEEPKAQASLANKDEVLALRFGAGSPRAIDHARLVREPIYRGRHGGVEFVVLTDASGAHRVFEAPTARLERHDDGRLVDETGVVWRPEEHALVGSDGQRRRRLPAHRAFWFGWRAAHPDTQLTR